MTNVAGGVEPKLPMLERAGVLDAERPFAEEALQRLTGKRKRGKHSRLWPGGLTVAVLALGFAMRWLA